MCPACVTAFLTSSTAVTGVIAGVATSTGGLAAAVVKKLRIRKIVQEKEKENGK
jgi:hypothetical protein